MIGNVENWVVVQVQFRRGMSYCTSISRSISILAGKEVVQVYVKIPSFNINRPKKERKGFAKIYIETGQTKEVSIIRDKYAFS
jgi:hypothetical protein